MEHIYRSGCLAVIHFSRKLATGLLAASLLSLVPPGPALAHHSFAVFFTADKDVTSIKGAVTAFRFTNPHGVIALKVKGPSGAVQEWRAETNAPVVLQRRGWTRTSLKVGETISIEGWGSRDGKPYLRLRRALRADGTPIGIPFGQGDS